MSNPAPSRAIAKNQSITGAPVARHVLFEIGILLTVHLAFALAVTIVLQSFNNF
jgi:predicted metal-binding membrane protein